MKTNISLLLVSEAGGRAVPIARIEDPEILRAAGLAAVREQRASTRRLQRQHPGLASASRLHERVLGEMLSGRGSR